MYNYYFSAEEPRRSIRGTNCPILTVRSPMTPSFAQLSPRSHPGIISFPGCGVWTVISNLGFVWIVTHAACSLICNPSQSPSTYHQPTSQSFPKSLLTKDIFSDGACPALVHMVRN